MRKATKTVAVEIVRLNKIPADKRRDDWSIAKGLLLEAAGYIKIGNDAQALLFVQAARPYLNFAEIL
jgi:hypothetical protein